MSKPAPSPGRPRDPRTHEAILDAARLLLAEVGYTRVSIQAIARKAGVGKTTIYRRWSSKALLVLEALLARSAGLTVPDLGSIEADLRALLHVLAVELDNPLLRKTIPGLLADFFADPELQTLVRQRFIFTTREALSVMFERAQTRGEIRFVPQTPATLAALVGAVVFRSVLSGLPLDNDFLEELLTILLHGLAKT